LASSTSTTDCGGSEVFSAACPVESGTTSTSSTGVVDPGWLASTRYSWATHEPGSSPAKSTRKGRPAAPVARKEPTKTSTRSGAVLAAVQTPLIGSCGVTRRDPESRLHIHCVYQAGLGVSDLSTTPHPPY